jgi:hypothetical protein
MTVKRFPTTGYQRWKKSPRQASRRMHGDRVRFYQGIGLPALPLALAQGGEVAVCLKGERQGSHGRRRH